MYKQTIQKLNSTINSHHTPLAKITNNLSINFISNYQKQKSKDLLLIFSLHVFMPSNLDGNNYFEKFVFVHAALINPVM